MFNSQDIELSQTVAYILGRLFLALDSSAYSDVASCFSSDGVWHRQGQILTGWPNIIAALEQRPVGRKTLHVLTNVVAESKDAQTVHASFYLIAYRHDSQPGERGSAPIVAPIAMGICQVRLVRLSDLWRIAELKTGPDYTFKATSAS